MNNIPLKRRVTKVVRTVVRGLGYEIHSRDGSWPADFSRDRVDDVLAVRPYTMTSKERLFALIEAVEYVVKNELPGSFVECGVWRGGSMMVVARTLLRLGVTDRDLFLYDTFKGMPEPCEIDRMPASHGGVIATELYEASRAGDHSEWCYASLEDVTRNVLSTGYPAARVHFVAGKVEETVPDERTPERIALLRLDTDFYESTKHELEQLYPRLVNKGVLIIDDYGSWEGARKATDEYIQNYRLPVLLNRIDASGRTAIKTE